MAWHLVAQAGGSLELLAQISACAGSLAAQSRGVIQHEPDPGGGVTPHATFIGSKCAQLTVTVPLVADPQSSLWLQLFCGPAGHGPVVLEETPRYCLSESFQ